MTYQEMLREQAADWLECETPCAGLSDDQTISGQFLRREGQACFPAGLSARVILPARADRGQGDWLPFVRKQLDAVASLPEGWDSYGAPRPDARLMRAARGLMDCLTLAPYLPQPHVNPTRNGGVQFEWEAGARHFEIEIIGERVAQFVYSDEDAGVEITGDVFEEESLDQVLACIYAIEQRT